MSIPSAYIAVVIIWSTTPLAIQWSGAEVGFLFGITSRMVIAAVVGGLLMLVLRVRLPWQGRARMTYLLTGLTLYLAMGGVYWAAQFMPSGWISVLFGLTPLMTGVMASVWLRERLMTPVHVSGIALALGGLALIFAEHLRVGDPTLAALLVLLFSVFVHSLGSIVVKRVGGQVPAIATTVGGVSVAAVFFLLTGLLTGERFPMQIPERAMWSILYLGVVASVFGFSFFYYVLKHVAATRVALITLMTPVLSLLLGNVFNAEPLDPSVVIGTALILSGLVCFEFVPRMWEKIAAAVR